MLVISRRLQTGITLDIGDIHVEVYVLRQNNQQIVLGIEADRHAVHVGRCDLPKPLMERKPCAPGS